MMFTDDENRVLVMYDCGTRMGTMRSILEALPFADGDAAEIMRSVHTKLAGMSDSGYRILMILARMPGGSRTV